MPSELSLKKELDRNLSPACRLQRWAYQGSVYIYIYNFFLISLEFWREPKSIADGSRMHLTGNPERAWMASQEASTFLDERGKPPPYGPHRHASAQQSAHRLINT